MCRIDGYNKCHHTLLHNTKHMNENKDANKKAAVNEQENENKIQSSLMDNHNSFDNKFTLLQIIPVILSNGIKNIETNALLDSGSDVTLISREVLSKLELHGVEKKQNITNTLSKASETKNETVKISILSVCNIFESLVDALNRKPCHVFDKFSWCLWF